jgi:hypothetical protein
MMPSKGFNTKVTKNKLKRMVDIFNEFYKYPAFVYGINIDRVHLSNNAFRDLAIKDTIAFETPNAPDKFIIATTSNCITIMTIMDRDETIEDYKQKENKNA